MPLGEVLGGSWGRPVLRRSGGGPGGVLGGSREGPDDRGLMEIRGF